MSVVDLQARRVVIPGEPYAQGRARARVVTPRGGGSFVHMYDPPEAKSWKGAAQVHMLAAMDRQPPRTGPLKVSILAVFSCPTAEHRKRDPRARRWHGKARGDADNIAKACLDAGNGVLWLDDSQVAWLTVRKIIGAQGEAPRVELLVEGLEEAGAVAREHTRCET